MWSNALRFMVVVAAALLATNYFEPVADQLDAWQPTYTYCWDFLSLWGLFAIFVVLFRAVTDQLSKVKVRFPGENRPGRRHRLQRRDRLGRWSASP